LSNYPFCGASLVEDNVIMTSLPVASKFETSDDKGDDLTEDSGTTTAFHDSCSDEFGLFNHLVTPSKKLRKN
jgi:hypothetical protein